MRGIEGGVSVVVSRCQFVLIGHSTIAFVTLKRRGGIGGVTIRPACEAQRGRNVLLHRQRVAGSVCGVSVEAVADCGGDGARTNVAV